MSSQRSPKGYPGLLDFKQDIMDNYLEKGAPDDWDFVPTNAIEEVVTKERVLLAFQETEVEKEKHEDLAIWVVESSKRLFLTLIFMTGTSEYLSQLEYLRNDGVDDNALPLRFHKAHPPYYGFPREQEIEKAQRFYSFKDWHDLDLALFAIYQRSFLPPAFDSNTKFRHQLHPRQPVPLFNQTAKDSVSGQILGGGIHAAHTALGMRESAINNTLPAHYTQTMLRRKLQFVRKDDKHVVYTEHPDHIHPQDMSVWLRGKYGESNVAIYLMQNTYVIYVKAEAVDKTEMDSLPTQDSSNTSHEPSENPGSDSQQKLADIKAAKEVLRQSKLRRLQGGQ
ncbi:hypothetical protein O1611_g1592 [Lasiodiplodia mahajangana]|uniref:Uncharacterized protein n=1 Tax=Lasiodiplodia mahajangana TaxID=1108764 RepID=A0ACC2JXK2_9PEZI|nr:hypothetical protein O1611_g1592 [Lasiodiplodia mahajangana]